MSKADAEAQARDAALMKQNMDDYLKRQQKIKLLLLGARAPACGGPAPLR